MNESERVMRVDASQMMGQSSPKTGVVSGAAAADMKVGDTLRAEVVSCKNGVAALKTENGSMLRAKLDSGVTLSPGDKVLLEAVGKEDGILALSIRKDDSAVRQEDLQLMGQNGFVKGFEDKSLAPYAGKLSELKMPVTEEAVRMMRDTMTQNPGVSIEEAAFLASNKLSGDSALVKAALALINGGEKTDEMIARLLALLEDQETALQDRELSSQGLRDIASARSQIPDSGVASGDPRQAVVTGNKAPFTELLNLIKESLSGPSGLPAQGEALADSTAVVIIPQSNSNLQSRNVGNFVEISTNSFSTEQQPVIVEQNVILPGGGQATVPTDSGAVLPAEAAPYPVGANDSLPASQARSLQTEAAELLQSAAAIGTDATDTAVVSAGAPRPEGANTQIDETGKALAEILSQVPEFQNTPLPAIERFSNMLYRVAMDSADVSKGETEKLMLSIEKLFTRIGRGENNEGERLKLAREEVFARIALIEEEISRAAPPARAEMLEQMGRLTDHLRLMNNINQFVYMQMPVILNDEYKTAELYMFKKKGGKRADSENVNILLALDLEHMGRWEALLNFRKKDVSVQMEVRGENEKKHFSENTVLLHEMLAEAGFKLVNTDIKFSKKETTPVTALSTLDRLAGSKTGKIDFWI